MIDPYLQAIMDAMQASGFRWPDPIEPVALRALLDAPMPAPPVEIAERRDVVIETPGGAIPARLYHPAPGKRLPVTLFFHGGGWVVGTLETHDRLAAALAARSGCALVSVAYRLAPEHPFPAAIEDALAVAARLPALAAEWGVDADRYALAGDSAGGNIAAAAALELAQAARPPLHQLLLYPVIEARFDTPSYRAAAEGGFLTPDQMRWFWDQYAPGALRDDPRAAPIRATSLAGAPPATILVAGNDPLHDEGVAYAERLRAAGVPVALHDFAGAIHGFASLFGMAPIADEAVDVAAAALRAALRVR